MALVGKEAVKFLEFADFWVEVRVVYEKAGSPRNVAAWYKLERMNHPSWPSNPDTIYKGKGWESWLALVGKEEVRLLEFADFLVEVRDAYEEAGLPVNKLAWYRTEQKKHPEWPSSPYRTYKDKGWEGFPALVGEN